MASFFDMATQDEMANFWVVFAANDETGVQVRRQYRDLLCPRCASFDPHAIVERGLDPELAVTHKKSAFTTNDGFLIVSQGAQAVLESLAGPRLAFHRLPGAPRYAVVLPQQPGGPFPDSPAVEVEAPCPGCRRRLFVRWHPERLALPADWAFGGLVFPAHRSLWAKWVGSAAAVQALKAARLKGWLPEPLVALPPAAPPTGPRVRSLAGVQTGGAGVAFSPDGRLLANAGGHDLAKQAEVLVWDVATGDVVWAHRARGRAFLTAAFAPDGQRLAAGGFGCEVLLFEVATGKAALTLKMPDEGYVNCLAFSPDGQTLACAQGGSVLLWDPQAGTLRQRFDPGDEPKGLAFSPDGRWLAFGGLGEIDVWPLAGGGRRKSLADNSGPVGGLAFSPDGSLLAAAGAGTKKRGEVLVWATATWKVQHRIACHRVSADAVAFAPNGHLLATGGAEKDVLLWGVPSGVKLAALKDHVAGEYGRLGLAFSPDGRTLACADAAGVGEVGRVTLYDLAGLRADAG